MFLKVGKIAPLGAILMCKGTKKTKRATGERKTPSERKYSTTNWWL